MSLKSLLSKIWNEIKNLFTSIPIDLKTAIHIGVIVTENIKTFIDSPAADIITALIPGNIDDKIKNLLRAKIPLILSELRLAENCNDITNPAELTSCAVKVLQDLDGDIKSAFLHNLSVIVAQTASDGKLTWSDGVYLLEWYYQHQFKSNN